MGLFSGGSDGLSKLKDIFNKGRNKTNTDEIRLPYRNGILHGRDLNYGNEYVSCKCVDLMFALADWMSMKDSEESRKNKFEKESNPPPISESLKKMKQNAIDREEISKWQPRNIIIGVDLPDIPTEKDCKSYPYLIPIIKTFLLWSKSNYGELSVLLKNMFPYEKSYGKRAGECRMLFETKKFESFKLIEIEERACSLVRVLVQVQWESRGKQYSVPLEFGCIYQDENEELAYPWRGNGQWILMPWKVQGLYQN